MNPVLLRDHVRKELIRRGLLLDGDVPDFEVAPEWFHAAQRAAWAIEDRYVVVSAGWQSGKTVLIGPWLMREILRKGPGDYLAASTTYPLMSVKLQPELLKVFRRYATYNMSSRKFTFTPAGNRALHGMDWDGTSTVIHLGYTEDADSLESSTLKAAALDECGMKSVTDSVKRVIQSRLMVHRGRGLFVSRPFVKGHWVERMMGDDGVGAMSFPSWENPVNPPVSDPHWVQTRREMPSWFFDMAYGGQYTRSAGLIYDCFEEDEHVIDDPGLPRSWKVHVGLDFGEQNAAAVFVAEEPSGRVHVFESYKGGSQTVAHHVARIRRRAVFDIESCWGGSRSEDEWRRLFATAGLGVARPVVSEVEVGIARVYTAIKTGRLVFWRNRAAEVLDELRRYAREVDVDGNPTEAIADKSSFHRLDALRYVVSSLDPPTTSHFDRGYPVYYYREESLAG